MNRVQIGAGIGAIVLVTSLVIIIGILAGDQDGSDVLLTPGEAAQEQSPTEELEATPTVTLTEIPTETPEPTPTPTPEATPTPTSTPDPTPTATATPESTPTETPTPIPEPTPTRVATPIPSPAPEVRTVRRVETDERIISLTFDAGADRGYAEEILDILAEEGIPASFGITGVWAEQNPDLIVRIADEGHHLINHTYNHPSFTGFSTESGPLSSTDRIDQLQRTEKIIAGILGDESMRPYFRPPYGDYDEGVLNDIAEAGYTVNVMWSLDSLGWQGLSANEITQRAINDSDPGGILLFHVGAQSADAQALPHIIRELRGMEYSFITAEELVEG